jgi:hypothetical protein
MSDTTYDKKGIFNKLTTAELIRIGYIYVMFIFVAMILVKFQKLEYSHVFIMSTLYVIFTFIMEILWLYGFVKRYRTDVAKDVSARDTFHNILNNILPFTSLIFGFAILLDAFRSNSFASDGQHVEFYIRSIASLIFVIGYIYLFIELMNRLDSSKSNISGPPYEGWTTKYVDQKDATKFDSIIDLLYNLFQPFTVLIIASMIYFAVRATSGVGGGGGTPNVTGNPIPSPLKV